ncbi:hypothetical protein JCM8547_006827 [Rhodosporidiobolus lusitaniae]
MPSLLSFLPVLLTFPLLSFAQSFSATAFVAPLLSSSSSSTSDVYGERLNTKAYQLTMLANETDVQATLVVGSGVNEVGWVALGLGTEMSDAAMVVLWPSNDNSSEWIISHRTAGGHSSPYTDPSITSSTPGRWSLVPSLTSSSSSSASSTIVTITRTLALPSDQGVYPSNKLKYANLARRKNQKILFAMSTSRPVKDEETASLQMHTGEMFGATSVDLSQAYIKQTTTSKTTVSASRSGSAIAAEVTSVTGTGGAATDEGDDVEVNEAKDGELVGSAWSQRDYLILAHVVFAVLTWLVVAPAAVLIARLGRKSAGWFTWHSSVQVYLVAPFTIIVVALGVAAAQKAGTAGHLDGHKTLGILTIILLFFQLSLGYLAHTTPFASTRSSTRPLVRVVHILTGVLLLLIPWLTIGLGLRKWSNSPVASGGGSTGVKAVFILCILLFLLPALYSLFTLIRLRKREGRSFFNAAFGLGREKASPDVTIGRGWAAPLYPTGPAGGRGTGMGVRDEVGLREVKTGGGKEKENVEGWRASRWSR